MLTFMEQIDSLITAYQKFTSPLCKKYGLKPRELDILLYLHYHPNNATATEIVKKQSLSKSQVSESLRALDSRGLVAREFKDNNRKTIHLKLTDSAKIITAEGDATINSFVRTMLSDFSDEEVATFFSFLTRLRKSVAAYIKRT